MNLKYSIIQHNILKLYMQMNPGWIPGCLLRESFSLVYVTIWWLQCVLKEIYFKWRLACEFNIKNNISTCWTQHRNCCHLLQFEYKRLPTDSCLLFHTGHSNFGTFSYGLVARGKSQSSSQFQKSCELVL